MNEYQKAIFILKKNATTQSKENDLLKLAIVTEDLRLKSLLKETARGYHGYIKPGQIRRGDGGGYPLNYSEWRKLMFDDLFGCYNKLLTYCENILATEKPQWQIIAEENGWGKL
jgi:hypothetical protein